MDIEKMNKKIFHMGLRLSIVPLILLIIMTTVVTFAQAEEYLAPVITSISPDSGEQGQGLDLTISGYNFMEGVEVTFHPPEGIIVESVDFTDAQSVTTFIIIDIDALAGPRDVTVISPDGQSYTLDQGFTVTEAKPIIDVTPPPMITGLTATDAHDGNISLSWIPSEVEDFAFHAIYISETEITDVTGLSPIAKITDIAVRTYQVTELVDGTRYYVAVTAVDTVGNEGKAVTSVSATPTKRLRGELLNGQYTIDPEAKTITFTVTWTGDPSETVYVTVSNIDYPMEYSSVGQTLTVTRTFEELNLKPGDTFEFSFKAAGEEGMEKGTGEIPVTAAGEEGMEEGTGEIPEEGKTFPWWVVGLVGGLIALTTLVIMQVKKKPPKEKKKKETPIKKKPPKEKEKKETPTKKKPPKEKEKKETPTKKKVKGCGVFSEPDELTGEYLQTVTYNETVWVIDFDEDETWQKVITAKGTVGWVVTSHLIPDKKPDIHGKVAPGKAITSDEPGSGVKG